MVVINNDGITSYFPFQKVQPTPCVFEFVYFARPDSYIFGKNVYMVGKELGRQLARENRIEADIVIPVPDSGVPAAWDMPRNRASIRIRTYPQPLCRAYIH